MHNIRLEIAQRCPKGNSSPGVRSLEQCTKAGHRSHAEVIRKIGVISLVKACVAREDSDSIATGFETLFEIDD